MQEKPLRKQFYHCVNNIPSYSFTPSFLSHLIPRRILLLLTTCLHLQQHRTLNLQFHKLTTVSSGKFLQSVIQRLCSELKQLMLEEEELEGKMLSELIKTNKAWKLSLVCLAVKPSLGSGLLRGLGLSAR